MSKTIDIKDAVTVAAQIAQAVLSFSQQGYTNISVKQVNDPNDDGELQEQVLLDMQKDGEAVEVRLFSKEEEGKIVIKEKKGKHGKKG